MSSSSHGSIPLVGNDSFTKLLLHCEGTDSSLTFTDSSSSAHTVNSSGEAQVDTAQFKFGTASALFDGVFDTLNAPSHADYAFGTGDFTIDFWVRFNSTTGQQNIFEFGSAVPASAIYKPPGAVPLRYYNGADRITTTTVPSTGVWIHVALARSGTDTKLFIDGTQEGATYTDSTNYGQADINIGSTAGGPVTLNGWLDEIRVSKGIARWTSNFTPPTAPYG